MLRTKDEILPLAKLLMQQVEFHSHLIRLLGLGVSNPGSSSSNGRLASNQGAWRELELEFEPWPDTILPYKIILSIIALLSVTVMEAQKNQTHLTLNNGIVIPQFGLGVYSIPAGEVTYNSVLTALKAGYRHINTAHALSSRSG